MTAQRKRENRYKRVSWNLRRYEKSEEYNMHKTYEKTIYEYSKLINGKDAKIKILKYCLAVVVGDGELHKWHN